MVIDSCSLCFKLFWRPRVFCEECTTQIENAPILFRHLGQLGVFSLLQYTSLADRLVKLGKGAAYPQLLDALTVILCRKFLRNSFQTFQGIIPVPPKIFGRQDHAWCIGKSLSDRLQIPLYDSLLENQNMGKTEQKHEGLIGRSQLKVALADELDSVDFGKYKGALLLVDDVVTSGATLLQTWKALGCPVAIGLTLASRPRHSFPEMATDQVFTAEEVEKTDDF